MGYFDALTSSSFKDARDGSKLFFPWGVLGRGYVIESEVEFERLHEQIKTYMIIVFVTTMVVTTGALALWGYRAALLAAAILVVAFTIFSVAWMRTLLRDLRPSQERLSLRESMTTQARHHSGWLLWLLEISSLAFVVVGIRTVLWNPAKWLPAIAVIAFFGICAAVFGLMLILRRQS